MKLTNVTLRTVALIQGTYYSLTGLWAVGDIRSFQAVTGPKTDLWLVKTVGLLVLVVGLALLTAGIKRRFNLETVLLGVGCCLALAWIGTTYGLQGTIADVYLLDALVEIILVLLWILGWRNQPRRGRHHPGVNAGV